MLKVEWFCKAKLLIALSYDEKANERLMQEAIAEKMGIYEREWGEETARNFFIDGFLEAVERIKKETVIPQV